MKCGRAPLNQGPRILHILTQGPGGLMSVTLKAVPKTGRRDIQEVWTEYKKNKTEPLRNALMENYLHLVRYNAERIHVKLPDEVELDDLMSAGIFGLMDAIEAFDLNRGVKLKPTAPRAFAARSSTSCARWT